MNLYLFRAESSIIDFNFPKLIFHIAFWLANINTNFSIIQSKCLNLGNQFWEISFSWNQLTDDSALNGSYTEFLYVLYTFKIWWAFFTYLPSLKMRGIHQKHSDPKIMPKRKKNKDIWRLVTCILSSYWLISPVFLIWSMIWCTLVVLFYPDISNFTFWNVKI